MPAELPANPNLEFLRKQAKALLRDFRKNSPEAVAKLGTLKLKTAPTLSDAQFLVAREYGFENWAKLKEHVESLRAEIESAARLAQKAIDTDNVEELRGVLKRHPALKARINEPLGHFNSPLVTSVRSRAALDTLLDAGADINARSHWWAGSFGLLDNASQELSAYAMQRGATLNIHAAARLGMLENVKEMIAADPEAVHTRGGDGQMPLHFASTWEIAEYLLDHGAEIDARDLDHESTAAQYALKERPEITRYLIRRGCTSDILMAAALGDRPLAEEHLRKDPECIRMRVSDEYMPLISARNGGTIYQWQLGWHVSAVQVAKSYGHQELSDWLMERCPDEEKLLNACWLHDAGQVKSLLAQRPKLAEALPPAGRRHLAHAARNNDIVAMRLMLMAGLPTNASSQHGATPLHWAGFHGNVEMARLLLSHNADLENTENEFKGTPVNWTSYGSVNGWRVAQGDYPATMEVLLSAGAKLPKESYGTEAVKEVLRRHGMTV